MMVETLTQGKVKLINVFGEISFENCTEFKKSILRNILGEESVIILDMEKVTYINSMSLGIIVKAYSESKKHGKEFVICSLQDNIKKLFSITKLDRIIAIYNNREEAVKLFKG